MLHLRLKKKTIIGSLSLLLTSCSAHPSVVCHSWTADEKAQIRAKIIVLPPDDPIRWIDKDYQRVCISLK